MSNVPMDFVTNLLGANHAIAFVTVIALQVLKMFLPPDPSVGIGTGRFTVAPQYKKYLLLLAFVIGAILSILLDPHEGQAWRGKFGDGLQTGAYAVVFWQIYSVWFKPFFQGSGT